MTSAAESRRLDQWLWFARLVKSRSLAARLCTAGAITVNQAMITKANHIVRIGDTIGVPQGPFRRSVRLLGLGVRRGPAAEASLISTLEPIFNPLWVFIGTGEQPGPWAIAGGAVVVASVILRTLWPQPQRASTTSV